MEDSYHLGKSFREMCLESPGVEDLLPRGTAVGNDRVSRPAELRVHRSIFPAWRSLESRMMPENMVHRGSRSDPRAHCVPGGVSFCLLPRSQASIRFPQGQLYRRSL